MRRGRVLWEVGPNAGGPFPLRVPPWKDGLFFKARMGWKNFLNLRGFPKAMESEKMCLWERCTLEEKSKKGPPGIWEPTMYPGGFF